MHEAMRVNQKLQWSPWEVRVVRSVEYLLMEAAESEKGQPKRVTMWVTVIQVIGARLPNLFGAYIMPCCVLDTGHRLNVCPVGFWSCFGLVLPHYFLFLPFERVIFILCH
jgi:hypothetical protein